MLIAMAHRRTLKGVREHQVGREAERLNMGAQVIDANRGFEVAEVRERPW